MYISPELMNAWKDACKARTDQIRVEKDKLTAQEEAAKADALAHEMSGIAQAVGIMQELCQKAETQSMN